jgi:hypothetical protein
LVIEPPDAADEERILATLSATVRWLRRQSDVYPDQIGVVGWYRGGGQALSLAANTPLQACVVCDGPLTDEPATLAGLRGTPFLGIFAGNETPQKLAAFQKSLTEAHLPHKILVYNGVRPNFMEPLKEQTYAHEAAEKAWVEIYEFLGKYVEDASQNSPGLPTAAKRVATIPDLMRAVNGTTGARGNLAKDLEQTPSTPQQWDRIRANAALLAETGTLLQAQSPRKGSHGDWRERAKAFTVSAEVITEAADRRDYSRARRGLEQLAACCAACHRSHR